MSFQNCHIAAIGEKNRQVCPYQSVAKIASDQICRDRRIKSPGVAGLKRRRRGKCHASFKFRMGFFTYKLRNREAKMLFWHKHLKLIFYQQNNINVKYARSTYFNLPLIKSMGRCFSVINTFNYFFISSLT